MNKYHKYTPEEIRFIKNNISGCGCAKEMTKLFNQRFELSVTVKQMDCFITHYNFMRERCHKYTPEEIRFIKNNISGCGCAGEMTKLFNQRFELSVTVKQIKLFLKKNNISKERGRRRTAIGSEFIHNGYTMVKIADPDTWKQKHRLIWEKVNGPIPKDHVIVFADGNRSNITLENLLLVSTSERTVMCTKNLIYPYAELTRTGKMIADIYLLISYLRRGENKRNKSALGQCGTLRIREPTEQKN
jgi:hypothetical protein